MSIDIGDRYCFCQTQLGYRISHLVQKQNGNLSQYLCLLMLVFFIEAISTVSAQENSGRAVYHTGEGAMAILMQGKVKVPASRFPCANCHGQDGMGSREGATIMPPISWQFLNQTTPSRPAYTIDSLQRAILHGDAANGKKLGELMPRYEIDAQTLDSLVNYLQTLDAEQRIGITTDTISIDLPHDKIARVGFMAAMKQFNNDGGSYGRAVVAVKDGPHFLSADSLSTIISEQLQQAIQKHLLNALADDGISLVALSSGEPDAALNHIMKLVGLEYDQRARTMLVPGNTVNLPTIVNWLKQTNQDQSTITSGQSDKQPRIYASASAIAPYLQSLDSIQHQLVLIDLDEFAVNWALSKQYNALAASGFSVGTLLGEALLLSGRDLTRHAVMTNLNEIDLQDRLFTWRSTAQ